MGPGQEGNRAPEEGARPGGGAGDSTWTPGVRRRTFLKRGALAGGLLGAAGLGISELVGRGPSTPRVARVGDKRRIPPLPDDTPKPNILVLIVDQMRSPQWFPTGAALAAALPNISSLRSRAVSFERHYTAANDCSPSRGAMLTGLYSHQTGCLITGRSTLDPGFPTWGTMLRELGYQTTWWGKWHLSHGHTLEPYGFDGGTFPSPNGAPGQGLRADPRIATQFARWFTDHGAEVPWCTTVSFVNPHDVTWWYRRSERFARERAAPRVFQTLPPNFETADDLVARDKPRLQRSLQTTAAKSFGAVPFSGPDAEPTWTQLLDLYLELQRDVDVQVGRVLGALEANPEVAANTVVVFTADHGEYGASHGLRGKGAGAYEEAIRVPLLVADPRGKLTSATGTPRYQLTSSVDLAPLLVTIASGSSGWRNDSVYSHIARRLDLATICANPGAPGRDYVVHATDEIATEFAPELYSASAPLHVVAVRTPESKYATYSDWQPGATKIVHANQDVELYDYRHEQGWLELQNAAGRSLLEPQLSDLLNQEALPNELRAPLPSRLQQAQRRGYANYFRAAARAATQAATDRVLAAERANRLPLLRQAPPVRSGALAPRFGPPPPRRGLRLRLRRFR